MGLALTYRAIKGSPLVDDEIDANFAAIDAGFDAIQDAVYQVDRFEADVDEGVFEVFLTDGRSSGPIPMAPRPFRHRGPWAAGVQYLDGDLVIVRKAVVHNSPSIVAGLYRASSTHQSTTLVADLGDNKLVLLVEAGEDATHFEGDWQEGQVYAANATVRHEFTIWQCFVDVAAGVEPGVDLDTSGPFPVPIWFAVTSPPRRLVRAAWDGKPAAGAASPRDLIDQVCFLRAGLRYSLARLETAPAADTTYSIRRNGAQIATLKFPAGMTFGTFTMAEDLLILPGDRINVVAPTPQDANAASPTITLVLTVLGT